MGYLNKRKGISTGGRPNQGASLEQAFALQESRIRRRLDLIALNHRNTRRKSRFRDVLETALLPAEEATLTVKRGIV